jgi:hypothetical protein
MHAKPLAAVLLALAALALAVTPPRSTSAADDAPKPADAAKADDAAKTDDAAQAAAVKPDSDGFYSLFDGRTLNGWKVGKNPETFKVTDGMICASGPGPSHLFYVGPVQKHNFKDFHFKAEVMTFPNANSGIYFHTKFQEEGWPSQGFECQVNNTYEKDPRKTASLYAVKDVKQAAAKDNEWFTYEIIVKGRQITMKINGKTVNEHTIAEDYQPPRNMAGRKLGSGTFALQGHDPGSKVCYRNIKVKPLGE